MRIAFSHLRARMGEAERRERMWRVVKSIVGSLVAGGAGLIFGFAMGLHDARWPDASINVGHAHRNSPYSAADAVASCPRSFS